MPQIRGVEHLVMNVADPEVTARFYCDVFGFEVSQQLDDKGIVALRHPSARLGIGLRRRVGDPPATARFVASPGCDTHPLSAGEAVSVGYLPRAARTRPVPGAVRGGREWPTWLR